MTYDGNQNMTYDGVNTLTYDVENRLTQAVNPAWGTSTYLYDPLGHRKQKQVTSPGYVITTQFVLAGGQEIADYSGTGAGAAIQLTVRGAGGLPVASIMPSSSGAAVVAAYYHHDVMGSTVAATEPGESGAAMVFTYSDFGVPGAGSGLAYTYAGYRYDTETGLYYVNARYYNPNLGRFLQTDPIGLQGGTNLYAYVGNDAINLIDPTGLCKDAPASFTYSEISEMTGTANLPNMSSIFGNTTPNVALGPQLSYNTLMGGPGSNNWEIQWVVTPASTTGGIIVQNITTTNAAGAQTSNYWEAWTVPANSQYTTFHVDNPSNPIYNTDDMFLNNPSGTTVNAQAAFYPGQQLPSSFVTPSNPNQSLSGELPISMVNPNLPNPSLATTNTSPPVSRTFVAP